MESINFKWEEPILGVAVWRWESHMWSSVLTMGSRQLLYEQISYKNGFSSHSLTVSGLSCPSASYHGIIQCADSGYSVALILYFL